MFYLNKIINRVGLRFTFELLICVNLIKSSRSIEGNLNINKYHIKEKKGKETKLI